MTIEEKVRFAESKRMIMWYGCRSLVDNRELAEIEKEIKETKED